MSVVLAAAQNSTGVALIAGVFIAGGYLMLLALWFLVFRPASREEEHPPLPPGPGAPAADPDTNPADPNTPAEVS